MGRAFTEFTFTPSVKRVQTEFGSRRQNERLEDDSERQDVLGLAEARFIAERDGFYQATVAEGGWPYVQFRGGPAGFLKVLSPSSIGYADFRGNRQYLSVGNLDADVRVAMILMDYAQQRRLKIWGHGRAVRRDQDLALVERLTVPGYRATVERGIVIDVKAFDWNCPQHITPRYTVEEFGLEADDSTQNPLAMPS